MLYETFLFLWDCKWNAYLLDFFTCFFFTDFSLLSQYNRHGGLLHTPSVRCMSKQLPAGTDPRYLEGRLLVPNIYSLLFFTFLNLISYNGQGLSPDGDIYQMVDYFSHIELLYERQLLPCCFRSLAIFHVPMEHVEMLLHFPAATEIHSSNPCRAWVIVFRLNVTACSFLKLYLIWEILFAEADFYPFFSLLIF